MKQKDAERRRVPRFCVNQLIRVSALQEEYLWAAALDVSADGFRARSDAPVDPLTTVYAMLNLLGPDGGAMVELEGYVARSHMDGDQCEFAVVINRMSPEDRETFDQWLASLDPGDRTEGCADN